MYCENSSVSSDFTGLIQTQASNISWQFTEHRFMPYRMWACIPCPNQISIPDDNRLSWWMGVRVIGVLMFRLGGRGASGGRSSAWLCGCVRASEGNSNAQGNDGRMFCFHQTDNGKVWDGRSRAGPDTRDISCHGPPCVGSIGVSSFRRYVFPYL